MTEEESSKRDEEIAALKEKGIETYKQEWHEALMSSGGSQRERMRQPLWQMIEDWSAWQPLHKEVRLFYGKEAWKALRERGTTDVPTLLIRGENEVKGRKGEPGEMKHLTPATNPKIESLNTNISTAAKAPKPVMSVKGDLPIRMETTTIAPRKATST